MTLVAQSEPSIAIDAAQPQQVRVKVRRAVWDALWYASQIALIMALVLAAYCVAREYSMRSYLRGFSDAVIPASAMPMAKVQAILNWMSHGPKRDQSTPGDAFSDRDPSDTLNYAALLRTCGSATNAFINLADTAGLSSRRLLLEDNRGSVMHVVAEVLMNGRWIVVDPTFRAVMKGSDGHPLTREELLDSSTLHEATQGLEGYSPDYNYRNTAHLHTSRLPLGNFVAASVRTVFPSWDASPAISLVVERSSLAAAIISIALAVLLSFFRAVLILVRRRHKQSPLSTLPAV